MTVKNDKWCLEKNKTIIFDNIEENISWLESVRSKIKNILILMLPSQCGLALIPVNRTLSVGVNNE